MKTFFSILVFCFCCLNSNAEKYGLIIAIGDYPEEGGWPDISSKNDIVHINEALKILGFNSDKITIVSDDSATKSGILKTLKDLESKLQKGDMVYIHFSGHGQQVIDDNGDEIDNLDEAIVPYNSFIHYVEGYNEGQNLIRDDELGEITKRMRKRCGKKGQVILILDSCHSGTGTRGMGKARGTTTVMAPENFRPTKSAKERNMGIGVTNDSELAPMACFFGASSGELNFETLDDQANPVGSLSYSIATILANMKSSFSFEELFERVKLKMKTLAPRQNPQWEGPINTFVLGGQLEEKEALYAIKKIVNPTTVVAEIGSMINVYENTKVEVVSIDQETVLANGIVKNSKLLESTIELDAALDLQEGELIKLRIMEKCEPPVKCHVHLNIDTQSIWYTIMQDVKSAAFFHQVDENADIFISTNGDVLSITTKEGDLIYKEAYKDSNSRGYPYIINKHLNAFVQGKILRAYNNPESSFDFSLEVLKTNCDIDSNTEDEIIKDLDINIAVGSCIKFKISNTGNNKAYFSLIDIQPDNVINLVIPAIELGYTASEYVLNPGESYVTDYSIEVAEPLGEETLKLISSNSPLDLSGIIRANSLGSTRGLMDLQNDLPTHPFEQLLQSTYMNSATRGTRIKKASAEEIGTETLYFKIIK